MSWWCSLLVMFFRLLHPNMDIYNYLINCTGVVL